MKHSKIKHLTKNILAVALITMLIFSLNSCSKKITFLSSSVVPGAAGAVSVKKDDNNNYQVLIQITDLAEADKLQPPKKTYIVWMLTDEQIPKNIGQINSSSSILSSRLKAEFETVTTTKPTKIFLTAEDDANVQYPGAQVILSTTSF